MATEKWMIETWKTQVFCISASQQFKNSHIPSIELWTSTIRTWNAENMSAMFQLMLPNDCLPTLSGYWSGISRTLPWRGSTWFKLPAWLDLDVQIFRLKGPKSVVSKLVSWSLNHFHGHIFVHLNSVWPLGPLWVNSTFSRDSLSVLRYDSAN